MGKHHTIREDDDLFEPQVHGSGQGREEVFVYGGFSTEKGEVCCAGCSGLLECLQDGLDGYGPGNFQRRKLPTRTEDTAVVAQMPELDFESMPRLRGRDICGRTAVFRRDIGGGPHCRHIVD